MTTIAPDRRRSALRRAFARGLQREVRAGGGKTYLVPSQTRPGLLHQVTLTSRRGQPHLVCSCEAGAMGQPCAHAAAVWLYRLEAGGARVLTIRPPPGTLLG